MALPGGNAALRDRVVLNRLGARREARQERLSRPANDPRGPAPGAAGRPQPPNGQPQRAPQLDSDAIGQRQPGPVRSAQYAPGDIRDPAAAQPASATAPLPANRLPYTGAGVSLRLPADVGGEVNYLVDNAQVMVIGSGEEQLLRAKPQYEIRFSRGVDDDGRSYGEARYTITEGTYRFAVTDKGWELFREADGLKASPSSRLEPLQSAATGTQAIVPEPLEPSRQSELRHRGSVSVPQSSTEAGDALEAGTESGFESGAESVPPAAPEALPVPTLRSILERE